MDSATDHAAGTKPGRAGLPGASGQVREVASYLPPGMKVFWAVSSDYLEAAGHDQVDITSPSTAARNAPVVGAVGAPALLRDVVAAWPGDRFVTVVSSAAYVDPPCAIGAGTVIAPGAVLTVDLVVGEHCQVNIGAMLSHYVYLGSLVTYRRGLAPCGTGAPRRRGVRRRSGERLERRDARIGVVVGAGAGGAGRRDDAQRGRGGRACLRGQGPGRVA